MEIFTSKVKQTEQTDKTCILTGTQQDEGRSLVVAACKSMLGQRQHRNGSAGA